LNVGCLNDLWIYNISSGQWAWLSGNNTGFVPGVYGQKGVPSLNNYPGCRYDQSTVLDETMNCIYVFGGYGYPRVSLWGIIFSWRLSHNM
jgi:hypothetical protein